MCVNAYINVCLCREHVCVFLGMKEELSLPHL